MTAEELAEGSRERFKELEHKDWDWSSFYNGWLEGRADMLVSTDLEADLIKAGNRIQILEGENAQLNADSFHHAKRLLKLSDAKKQIKELDNKLNLLQPKLLEKDIKIKELKDENKSDFEFQKKLINKQAEQIKEMKDLLQYVANEHLNSTWLIWQMKKHGIEYKPPMKL